MKKIIILMSIVVFCVAPNAYAVTNSCVISLSEVRSGASGGKESYLMVTDGSDRYYLGLYTDERARLRFSMAMTALATGQTLVLEYYNITCANAIGDHTIVPTGVRIQ